MDNENRNFDDVTRQYINQPAMAGEDVNTQPTEQQSAMVPGEQTVQPIPPPAAQQTTTPAAQPTGGALTPDALAIIIKQIAQAQAENQQLKAAMEQQSKLKEQQIEETLVPPSLDFEQLQYADDATRKSAQAKYAQDMAAYTTQILDKKLAPVVDNVQQQQKQAAEQQAYSAFKTKATDADKYLPSIQAMFSGDNEIAAAMKNVSPALRYALGYLAAKGSESLNPAQKTAEQVAEEAYANPDVMRILEMKKATAIQNGNKVPPQTASSGIMPSTALNKPRTFDEAKQRWASRV